MLLFDDLNIIEVENGVMYLTSLYNFAQPLIRYRLSDHLVLKEPMPGSPFSRVEILLGEMKICCGSKIPLGVGISCIP